MSDNYQYHTVLLVTIIISRRIDRGISNWSVPAVRIVRAVWVMGRIVWTPRDPYQNDQIFTCGGLAWIPVPHAVRKVCARRILMDPGGHCTNIGPVL